MQKNICQPCLRNQEAIFQALKHYFLHPGQVLELACGTAQHAVYFSQRLSYLNWQPTDLAAALPNANLWIEDAKLDNLNEAMEFNVSTSNWPNQMYDYIYSANLVHFVPLEAVEDVFRGVNKSLRSKGLLAIYGPFNNEGFTSEGNKNLDAWLKTEVHPQAGIKELNDIKALGIQHGLLLIKNEPMPANNHLLVFEKH